ncbi:exonuclease domain-containing protein [Gardnerella vaginalis]|uniref:Exonuclease n=1 Tax=Gardnerella vaginalis TaxID=2702 RepID=A0A133NN09_GARVA|nr:exonuclease domain-containing protein [Gardnerella vaginalis]KXA17655.1 exonuclease [Gardnerella vaginalis]
MAKNIDELLEALEKAPQQDSNTTLCKSMLLGFDTETTGAIVGSDSICSATLVLRDPALGHNNDVIATWLVNPHKPINPKASEVNGFTDEFLQENGGDPTQEIELLGSAISLAQSKNIPLLAYNAPFDVKMLSHDLQRWSLEPLQNRQKSTVNGGEMLVVDPLVIDRAVSKRTGKRTLTYTTQFYAVEPIGDFHDATADTVAAVDLIKPISELHENVANLKLCEIMAWQREAYAKWKISFNNWLKSKGRPAGEGSWL